MFAHTFAACASFRTTTSPAAFDDDAMAHATMMLAAMPNTRHVNKSSAVRRRRWAMARVYRCVCGSTHPLRITNDSTPAVDDGKEVADIHRAIAIDIGRAGRQAWRGAVAPTVDDR